MADYIRIKKKDVRKILSLYTMEGLTQKQVASIVLGDSEIKGVSPYTIVQRVLHYLGINMEHRRNYKNDGLTDGIIDIILDNRTLAFPLAIPTDGGMNSAIQFDAEVNKYLGNNGKKWKVVSALKNAAVLAMMAVLTYFSLMSNNGKVNDIISILIVLGLTAFSAGMEGYQGRGVENDGAGGIIVPILMFLFLAVMMSIGVILG